MNMKSGPRAVENILVEKRIEVERKTFTFFLKENPRGRFLRINEDSGRYRNSIIIPSTGFGDFEKLLAEMIEVAKPSP